MREVYAINGKNTLSVKLTDDNAVVFSLNGNTDELIKKYGYRPDNFFVQAYIEGFFIWHVHEKRIIYHILNIAYPNNYKCSNGHYKRFVINTVNFDTVLPIVVSNSFLLVACCTKNLQSTITMGVYDLSTTIQLNRYLIHQTSPLVDCTNFTSVTMYGAVQYPEVSRSWRVTLGWVENGVICMKNVYFSYKSLKLGPFVSLMKTTSEFLGFSELDGNLNLVMGNRSIIYDFQGNLLKGEE